MPNYIHKAQKEKKQSLHATVSQKQDNNGSVFGFTDHRPVTLQMKKLQKLADNSAIHTSVQFEDNRPKISNQVSIQRFSKRSSPIQFTKDGVPESQSGSSSWGTPSFTTPLDSMRATIRQAMTVPPSTHWDTMMKSITNPDTGMPYNPMQHVMQSMVPMQEQFASRYPWMMPHLQNAHTSALEFAGGAKRFASDRIDSGMHYIGNSMLDISRDNFKLDHHSDDSYRWMFQKYAFNAGIDVAAMLASPVLNATAGFASGIGDKIGETTLDRVHPSHLWTIMQHPDFISHYLSQRKEQIMQPIRFYQDPKGFSHAKYHQIGNSLSNAYAHYNSLDPGLMGAVTHGGRAVVDFAQDNIAPGLGVALATFAMYNTGKRRERTMWAMDRMFPKDTLYGKAARFLPNRLMFAKPLSRIRGNPMFSAALLTYLMATSLGKNYEDMQELKEVDPDMYKRLEENNSESYASSTNLSIKESIERTSRTT
ncbi:hypothetical protein [Aquimarina algicola]|uniref:Uncharacterized protein n=1 Tax=Aquimarina algicola TaxID=2589995 RepID=A0A504J664_9FLAO|nr:hypothetical protein [Aquimarina algicola]TPN83468.1 hypothetical protein FHK87_19820 [Aquimarina algicola]